VQGSVLQCVLQCVPLNCSASREGDVTACCGIRCAKLREPVTMKESVVGFFWKSLFQRVGLFLNQ